MEGHIHNPQLSESVSEDESSEEYETDTGGHDDSYHPPRMLPEQDQQLSNITLRPRNKNVQQEKGLLCLPMNVSDPQNEEALSSTDAGEWRKAMDEEYNSLMENETWKLIDLPAGKKALPCKWVFKTKTDQQGNIIRYKARLVIKGNAQKRGTDDQEVYSPVVRYTSIRYLFALAAQHGLQVHQMDAVSAFLQGKIDTDIYMLQPERYAKGKQVCCLLKSIYGLRQASRLWNTKLSEVLEEMGIKK